MAGFADRPPTFLSARSADVILSEIRPTKLNPEAWRSINVLLDELLWLILSTARSFSTESIKAGLLKVLPTPLGKEALLEAEVELRAYWDRTATAAPSRSYVDNVHEFPLQPAYELMRLKCETYSTLSDSDEDTDAEDRWQLKVTNASGFSPHNVPYISPAALYLTAIIEAVCEHILSNIGRVTARDSSRTTASLQDLYTALCEDETIYGLFKNMKVHEQIEAQSKAFGRPRRSKSINRPDHGRTPSHALSASFSTITGSDGLPAPPSKTRASSESAASGTPNASGVSLGQSASRGSLEKTRAKKLFGRGSAEKDGSQNSHGNNDNAGFHKRTESILSNGKRSTTPFDEGQHSPSATEVEFDELMRSGTTMKVSLTPDRLKSFEVYNKERGQRGTTKPAPRSTPPPSNNSNSNGNGEMKTTNGAGGVPSEAPITSDAPPSLPPINGQTTTQSARPSVQHESIMEDEEGGGSSSSSQRQRKKSRGPPPVAYDQGSLNSQTNRNRSMSAASVSLSHSHSQSQSQGASQGRHNVGRKSSLGAIGYIAPPPGSAGTGVGVGVGHHRGIGSRSGMSSKSGILDHDSLLDSDDDLPLMKKRGIGFQPKEARGGSGGTRDLISFLNEGPPEPPVPLPLPAESGRKQGRFKSMVSRLKRGGSTEKLTHSEQSSRNSSGMPPSFVPPPLSAKKSLHSISTYAQSQDGSSSVMQKTPVSPPSPPSSPSHEEKEVKKGGMMPSSGRLPVPSAANRKAVPLLNGNAIPQHQQQTSVPPPPPPPPSQQQPQHQQVETLIAHKEVKKDAKPIEADIMTASSTTTLTASPRQDSLPRTNQSQVHSKHTARHALTPPASPASHVFANHVKDLRRLLANASNADECRLLVDMFLAQSGFPLSTAEYVQQQPSLDEGLDKLQNEVVEALLSNGDAVSTTTSTSTTSADSTNPPTPKSNTHSPTITNFRKQAHATDTLAMAHVVSAEA